MKTRIQDLRKELGVTQSELADAVDVTRQTIISLEGGRYKASLVLAHKLAQFFHVTIEELFIFLTFYIFTLLIKSINQYKKYYNLKLFVCDTDRSTKVCWEDGCSGFSIEDKRICGDCFCFISVSPFSIFFSNGTSSNRIFLSNTAISDFSSFNSSSFFHVPPTTSRSVGKSFSNFSFSVLYCSVSFGMRSSALRKFVAAALWSDIANCPLL